MDEKNPVNGYNVHTLKDRREMLDAIGLSSIDDLFSQIPSEIRLHRPLNLPPAQSEWELDKRLHALAAQNATTRTHLSLLGGGAYEHYIPAVVPTLTARGEYLTAYTPYQPEMSQGILRVLHDFQIVMGRMLGLPAVNCSVYDGATALAEAAWMACSITNRRHVVVTEALWPEYSQVLNTYMRGRNVTVSVIPTDAMTGSMDLEKLAGSLKDTPAAAVLTQTPNGYGVLEPIEHISKMCHSCGTLSNVSCYPMMLGCLKAPGKQGADIVTCEGQSLGLALNGGGPYLGVMATHEDNIKFLPGRIVGECDDLKMEKALALVKESREQHVARDKATSHICSNQALLAMRILVYLSAVGEHGFQKISRLNASKAHYICERLCELPGVRRTHTGHFFNEFLLDLPCETAPLLVTLQKQGIFGGIDFSRLYPNSDRKLLLAVTETKSKTELDRITDVFRRAIAELGGVIRS